MSKRETTMDANEAERLAAEAAPQAQALARKQQDEQKKLVEQQRDRAERRFCIEQATKACAAGGYDVPDIFKLTQTFYGFLIGMAPSDAAMREGVVNESSKRK